MANWDKVKSRVSRTANKAAVRAGELGEELKLNYKLYQAKGELDCAYEKLGRLTYDQLHYGNDRTEEVRDMVTHIGTLRAKVHRLKAATAKEGSGMFCANCGTKLSGAMIFCPGCGIRQKDDPIESAE